MNPASRPLANTIWDSFSLIADPRAENAAHPLATVLFCGVVGVLCGGDGFVQIAEIARLKKKFIKKYVPLHKNEIPTHDTIARVFATIDPDQFADAFARFMARLTGRPERDIINMDGQTHRGVVGAAALQRNAKSARNQTHVVAAFSQFRNIVLAQLRSTRVANEVQAVQELLAILDISGTIITLDAAHTVYETLNLICDRKADFVVGVKGNASRLYADIKQAFKRGTPKVIETRERSHGKDELRRYEVLPAGGKAVEKHFRGVRSFIRVKRVNTSHSGKSTSTRYSYFASSLSPKEAALIAECVRARWGIENKVHHVLDVQFRQDQSRARTLNAAENLGRLRHLALGLLSRGKPPGVSFALARVRTAVDDAFLSRVLRLPRR